MGSATPEGKPVPAPGDRRETADRSAGPGGPGGPSAERPGRPADLVDHLFRREAGRIVAALSRSLGSGHLDLAEESVQEAMIEALRRWPFHGVPERPGGWLYRVARNRALDRLRRQTSFRDKEPEIRRSLLADGPGEGVPEGSDPRRTGSSGTIPTAPSPDAVRTVRFPGELTDDQLRLIFLCCHPELPPDARVTLTLKLACGFGVAEIARAFLDKESTVAQRLVRAKRTLRDRRMPVEVPAPAEIPARLDSVLEVLYLTFNEGYAASAGDEHVKADVCAEALRLTEELARLPGRLLEDFRPPIHALAALLCFQASRTPARTDARGTIVLMEDQDRSLWDRALVVRGFAHLERSAAGPRVTHYHLEAAIASHHAAAPDWAATDWPAILGLYDRLLALHPSPVVALNRAVALAHARDPEAGLAALDEVEHDPEARRTLSAYHLLPATRGTLLLQAGRPAEAARALRRALELCTSPAERRLLERRLAEAGARSDGEPA